MYEIDGEVYECEEDYLDTLKQDDWYSRSFEFEYCNPESGEWEPATMQVEATWDYGIHGYVLSYTSYEVDGSELDGIFDTSFPQIHDWLSDEDIPDDAVSW
jgi:hypothetical protein